MQSISNALNRFHEDGSWFARAKELQLFVVRTSGDLRKTILKLLPMLEFHADNFSPWVAFEDARTGDDDGWQARANRLAKNWESRREAFSKEGISLQEVKTATAPALPSKGGAGWLKSGRSQCSSGFALFQQTAAAVLRAVREPLRGLVLVVAPSQVDDPASLEKELGQLLSTPELKECRFVLVLDTALPPPRGLLDSLGERGLLCDCAVDPKQMEDDLEKMLAGGGGAEPSSTDFGASPRNALLPRRIDRPPEISKEERDAALREAGINPAFQEKGPFLRQRVLGAALAMKQGRGTDAVRQQREAAALCENLEMHEMKVICQITLASYFSGLGQQDLAVRELEDAARHAAKHRALQVESQAHLALGLLHGLAKRLPDAMREYAQAGRTAEAAKAAPLAIEAWRLAGQIALQGKSWPAVVTCFQEALRIASGSDPNAAKNSSAPDLARQLAALYRERGFHAQADSLYAQADQIERGETDAGGPEESWPERPLPLPRTRGA